MPKTEDKKRKTSKPLLINYLKLQEGNQKFQRELTNEELEIKNIVICGLINVDLNLQKNDTLVIASGIVKFTADLCCANCLENFQKEFCEKVYQEYVQGINPNPISHSHLDGVDFAREYFTNDYFDLTPIIHDTIHLAIPLAPWCREDCPGVAKEN
jgi:uncharacterized protein